MGKHSAIGPIDPQIIFTRRDGSKFIAPAQSILDEFETIKKSVKEDPKSAPIWIKRLEKYDIGFLIMCENVIELSQKRVETWLTNWMFKNDKQREKKAAEISDWLGDLKNHKVHGRPINLIAAKDKGLKVIPLEDDQKLQEHLLSVFHAMIATHDMSNCTKFIENHIGKGLYLNIKVQQKQ